MRIMAKYDETITLLLQSERLYLACDACSEVASHPYDKKKNCTHFTEKIIN